MLQRRLKMLARRIYKPQVLRRIDSTCTMRPREITKTDNAGVYIATEITDAAQWRQRAEKLWTDIAGTIEPDHSVLIKVNLNTADPYPASTDPAMLSALIDMLRMQGIREIFVADCASISALPTGRTAKKSGIIKALAGRAQFVSFDDGPWVTVSIEGLYLKTITVPRLALDVDHIIHLANMKTHCLADFSFGLKLSVGYMHPLERIKMHHDHLQERLIEISLALSPEITIIDARTAFITGGPITGQTYKAGMVIMGNNPLAVDVEAYRQIYSIKYANNCIGDFHEDPWEMAQFKHVREIGLSARWGENYINRFF